MNGFIVNLLLLGSFMDSSREAVDSRTVVMPKYKPLRVGQIFILGNDRTKMNVILRQVGLYPGQVLSISDVRQAQRNLARLNIFKSTPDGAVRPTIIVEDDPNCPESAYKNVIIKVEEDNTYRVSLKHSLNRKGEWTIHFVLEERNFDPFRFSESTADFREGRAFRGAGLTIGVDVRLKVPLLLSRAPCGSLKIKWPVAP
jgi:outer membrane protein assembly factor BamA